MSKTAVRWILSSHSGTKTREREMEASYNAILLPAVRYHQQLSAEAKVIFAELTALIDENCQCEYNELYFSRELNIRPACVHKSFDELKQYNFIEINNGFIQVKLI